MNAHFSSFLFPTDDDDGRLISLDGGKKNSIFNYDELRNNSSYSRFFSWSHSMTYRGQI